MMDLSLVDSCLTKCSVNFKEESSVNSLNASEMPCMTKCFNKFFDSNLITDKELTMYTVGNPYV